MNCRSWTTMILSIATVVCGSAQEVKRHFELAKIIPFSVSITAPSLPVSASDPILLSVVSTNRLKEAVEIGFDMSHEPQYDWDIDVVSSNGKHAALTPAGEYFFSGRYAISGSYDTRKIAPGEAFVQSVDLRKLFLLPPGTYRVKVSQGKLVSNTLEFTVLANSSGSGSHASIGRDSH